MTKQYPNVTAHQLVANLAVEMAQEVYEKVMSSSNTLYKVHANREDFIRRCAPTLLNAAKAILGQMLNNPSVSEAEKQTIYEALVLDYHLPKGGTSITRIH